MVQLEDGYAYLRQRVCSLVVVISWRVRALLLFDVILSLRLLTRRYGSVM